VIGWSLLIGWFVLVGSLAGDWQFLKHVLYVALFLVVISQFVDPNFFNAPLFSRILFWSVALYVLRFFGFLLADRSLCFWRKGVVAPQSDDRPNLYQHVDHQLLRVGFTYLVFTTAFCRTWASACCLPFS
jgi:hypothetical protein